MSDYSKMNANEVLQKLVTYQPYKGKYYKDVKEDVKGLLGSDGVAMLRKRLQELEEENNVVNKEVVEISKKSKKSTKKVEEAEETKPKKKSKKANKEEESEEETKPKKKSKKEEESEAKTKPKKKSKKANKEEESKEETKPKKKSKKEEESEAETKTKKKSKKNKEEESKEEKRGRSPTVADSSADETKTKKSKTSKKQSATVSGETSDKNNELIQQLLVKQLDELNKQCRQDSSIESLCDAEFWMTRFSNDNLPVLHQQNNFQAWMKEYKLMAAAKTEIIKLVKVAIVTSKHEFANIKLSLEKQYLYLLPEGVEHDKETTEVFMRCDFEKGNALGEYLNDQSTCWVMGRNNKTNDEDEKTSDETKVSYSEVLKFLTKLQYLMNNRGLELTIESDDGILSRKDLEDSGIGEDTLLCYKCFDFDVLNK